MSRVVLILPASTYRADEFLSAITSLSAEPIVVSEANPLLAVTLGDRFVDMASCDPDEITRRVAALKPVDGLVSPDDSMVELANQVARALDLPSNPPSGVAATRNKAAFRRALNGVVPQPRFHVAELGTDIAERVREIGPPVVLKPLSLSGSQGVIRVDDPSEAPDIEQRIRHILAVRGANPNEPILIEKFVPGPEVAVEGILVDGDLELLAVFDKPDPLDGPYFEETLYVTPSRHHPEVILGIRDVVQEACRALGLVTGPVHAELRIDGSTVIIIEMAARPIGGRCGTALEFGLLGTSQETLIVRAALGMPITARHLRNSVGSLMIPIPATGRLVGVGGVDEARTIEHITGVEISIPIGEYVQALPEGNRYLGFAYARSSSPEDTEAALRVVVETLEVEIDAG